MAFASETLPASFYERPAPDVAPDLLGKLLVRSDGPALAGRIVEVEAYSGDGDPAAHSRSGPTARNAAMFGPPGTLYVYRIYGLHWCANAVCAPPGTGDAVLLRALEPLCGYDVLAANRSSGGRRIQCVDLCSGPAKLTQAFGIDAGHDRSDLTAPTGLSIRDGDWVPPDITATQRIGISRGTDRPWRWYVTGNPHVSRGRP